MPVSPRHRPRHILALSAAGITALLTILITTAQPDTPPPAQHIIRQTLAPVHFQAPSPTGRYPYSQTVTAGDTLPDTLRRIRLPEADIQAILNTELIRNQTVLLKPEQHFDFHTNEHGQIQSIQFIHDSEGETALIVLQKQGLTWQAKIGDIRTQAIAIVKAVPIRTSFRGDLARAEIPVAIRESLQEMFGERLILNQLTKGDSIRIYYEIQYFNGEPLNTGDILGVEISHAGQIYSAYLFGQAEHAQHYDETGEPMRQGFEILPVAGARISSPYGFRTHPVLGGWRMHTGIDYAAPTGTPVVAPNAGYVEYQSWRGGYGHTVILRHNDHLQTLYAHLSRYADTAPLGSYVQAGDVIGYIGSTGISTGPHLHYEVRLDGQHVNPAAIALPARRLEDHERRTFAAQQQRVQALLQPLRGLPHATAEPD